MLYESIHLGSETPGVAPLKEISDQGVTGTRIIGISSFNCKNIATSSLTISDLFKPSDIVLVQEHWLFQSQTNLLSEVSEDINSAGKGTDYGNPILPTQLPHGYGGIGILWKRELDPRIKILEDGGNRIQCIQFLEFSETKDVVIISVYLPCRGLNGNVNEFCDCIDQLREIILKYQTDHYILIGGDLNENLGQTTESRRLTYLKELITDFELEFELTGRTYVDPYGNQCSEIDYFLYNVSPMLTAEKKKVLNDIPTNTSDHYPITMKLTANMKPKPETADNTTNSRVNWKKINKHMYTNNVSVGLDDLVKRGETSKEDTEYLIQGLCTLLNEAATTAAGTKKSKPKLKMWSPEIKDKTSKARAAYREWKKAGKPKGDSELFIERNNTKKLLRASIRQALALKDVELKQKIIDSRKYDAKLFHQLVNSQRNRNSRVITSLSVGDQQFHDSDIVKGFCEHFAALGRQGNDERYDEWYHQIVDIEYKLTVNANRNGYVQSVTMKELGEAISSLNTGKAPDIYNLSVEHIIHSGLEVREHLLSIINRIFSSGRFPTTLKKGLVTPIFKNKGEASVSSNYRGITVLPVIGKIIEAVLRERIAPDVIRLQNGYQRGFTKNSSPLNSAFMVEGLYRESKDNKSELHLIFLDAKSAFDVVDHKHMMRRLSQIGVDKHHWSLIDSFHKDSVSAVKWGGLTSSSFNVQQGVRQGGVLSTDLYKVYVNPLLDRLQQVNIGSTIGDVRCAASACADDICLSADTKCDAQELLNISSEFANMERYVLQPTKSVHIHVSHKRNKPGSTFFMNDSELPNVKRAMHLGIIRTESVLNNQKENVEENLKKARRKAYSLFGSGYRGQVGMNISVVVHLYITYVIQVLLYGLELILPSERLVNGLEMFQRKFVKEILQLPDTTANPAVYLITGLLPVEAQIHIRALAFLHTLCSQDEDSFERKIMERQLQAKTVDSLSWFTDVRRILWKHDMDSIEDIISDLPRKSKWKSYIHNAVNKYWTEHIGRLTPLYTSLRFLKEDKFIPGKVLPLVAPEYTARESERLKIKLRLLTGTYQLQSTRKNFNQYDIDPVCQICGNADETPEHFVLACSEMENVRKTVFKDITSQWRSVTNSDFEALPSSEQVQLIINSWPFLQDILKNPICGDFHEFEKHCGRLLYNLDQERQILLLSKARQELTKKKSRSQV